jgi:hypothetical protein
MAGHGEDGRRSATTVKKGFAGPVERERRRRNPLRKRNDSTGPRKSGRKQLVILFTR